MSTLKIPRDERHLFAKAGVLMLPPQPTLDTVFAAALFFKAEEEERYRLGGDPLVISTGEVDWREELAKGRICLGFARSPLDPGAYQVPVTCAQLAAEFLGMEKRPWLRELLGELERLSKGSFTPGYFHLARTIPVAVGGANSLEVVSHKITEDLLPLLENQQRFCTEALVLARRAEWYEVGDKKICVGQEVELQDFQRAARHLGADLVIQRQPSGNVQIFASERKLRQELERVLNDLVQCLRARELEISGEEEQLRRLRATSALRQKKLAFKDDRWCYWKTYILNGSRNTPAPPTQIPLSDKEGIGILEMAKAALTRGTPAGSECKPHECEACRWYFAGLERCQRVREDARGIKPRPPARRPHTKSSR
jgi:hypothetical protein